MTLRARVLPREEWYRLAGTESAEAAMLPEPVDAEVLVVENERGEIVGTWTLMHATLAHGLGISPAYRNRVAAQRALLTLLRERLDARGEAVYFTTAIDDTVAALLEHAGAQPIPGRQYVVPVRKA